MESKTIKLGRHTFAEEDIEKFCSENGSDKSRIVEKHSALEKQLMTSLFPIVESIRKIPDKVLYDGKKYAIGRFEALDVSDIRITLFLEVDE